MLLSPLSPAATRTVLTTQRAFLEDLVVLHGSSERLASREHNPAPSHSLDFLSWLLPSLVAIGLRRGYSSVIGFNFPPLGTCRAATELGCHITSRGVVHRGEFLSPRHKVPHSLFFASFTILSGVNSLQLPNSSTCGTCPKVNFGS